MHRVLGPLVLVWLTASAFAAETPAPTWPLWDGHETVGQYAKRTNLLPMKTLDLGNGVNLELVLIPAGKFIMGTPEPAPVDEDGFHKKIVVGQAVFAAGIGVLLVLIGSVIVRVIRQRRRPQYSLARFIVMVLAASAGVMGGMHWWFSTRALAQAQAEYSAALARYRSSYDWEKPAHEVTLTMPFCLGKHEVAQEQYQQVMGTNPSHFKACDLPVDSVSWDAAQAFCRKAGERAGLTVRLPTEAEWEHACRAGTKTAYCSGDAETDLAGVGWYCKNSGGVTHPVAQKTANAWGVYDMHGNVYEWCEDDLHGNYNGAPADGRAWVDSPRTAIRVLRGGAWFLNPWNCRSASGYGNVPAVGNNYVGFRVVVGVTPRTP